MQQIRPWLYIGSYRDRQDSAMLHEQKIGAMLQLAGLVRIPNIDSLYLPIEDGEVVEQRIIMQGVSYIRAQHAAGSRVLVACGAGISRSTTFAIAAIKDAENLDLLGAARVVRMAHPNGMPHHALWSSLCAYYQEPVSYLAMLRVIEP